MLGQRAADARPDDPLDGDRHPPPHRRARLEADQGAGDRDLRSAATSSRSTSRGSSTSSRTSRRCSARPTRASRRSRSTAPASTRSPARLTALEFEGGVVLYDVLSVLQRAELVTRMAAEVERYIIELGTEGRLIEMQLEETVVGVMADAPRSSATTSPSTPSRARAALAELARARPHRAARLRSPRRAARLRPQDQHP